MDKNQVITYFKDLLSIRGNLNKIQNLFYPIIMILREKKEGKYNYKLQETDVVIQTPEGEELLRISASVFLKEAEMLLKAINANDGAFAIPQTEIFMNNIHCHTLKAKSTDKSDIHIIMNDLRTGTMPLLGFSIKSKLGHPSTLLNSGKTTNIIYKLTGNTLTTNQISQINNINSKSKIQDRIKSILQYGCNFEYLDYESQMFKSNLTLIDGDLPKILPFVLQEYYVNGKSKLSDIVDILQNTNPLNYNLTNNHPFYESKIKHLLTDIALGMTPSNLWNGKYDATGGYLIVREDGEVLCYHIYNKNDFEDYLLQNTRLETPSSTRYEFATIETLNSDYIFKLNLQIRFL